MAVTTLAPSAVKPQKSTEWYTPARYVEAAREVMNGIDLDPASCELANQTVKATRYYSQDDNGLMHPWYGRVWLNPPYAKINNKSGIEQFVKKLVTGYQSGNIAQAVLLVTVRTDAAWYQLLSQYPICFSDHIIHFYKPNANGLPEKDSRHGHFFGASFVYLGPNKQKFIDVFSQFGPIKKTVQSWQ